MNDRIWWLPGFVRITQTPHPGHPAYDLAAMLGSPILSPVSGRVRRVGWDPTGYGRYVDIETDGRVVRLAHMQQALVAPGQAVQAGQPIGQVGSTGRSTGPHVHLEVLQGQQRLDPGMLLTAQEAGKTPYTIGLGLQRWAAYVAALAAQRAGIEYGYQLRQPGAVQRVYAQVPAVVAGQTIVPVQQQAQAFVGEAVRQLRNPAQRLAFGTAGLLLILAGVAILAVGFRQQAVRMVTGMVIPGVSHAGGGGA